MSGAFNLAARNCESRIARFPESQAWSRQTFCNEKQNIGWNRSKVESQKSVQNRHLNRILSMLKATLESHDSYRMILNRPNTRFRIADSVPLRPLTCFGHTFWIFFFKPCFVSILIKCQEKASAEIRGEFFRPNSRVDFAVDFLVDFFGPFSLEKTGGKNPPKNPRQFSNQNLGVLGPKSTLQGSGLDKMFREQFRSADVPP